MRYTLKNTFTIFALLLSQLALAGRDSHINAKSSLAQSVVFSSSTLFPEGLEHWKKKNLFFVSSLRYGRIGTVDSKGQYKIFFDDPELISTIGLRISEKDNLLFACVSDPGPSIKTKASTQGKLAKLVAIDLEKATKAFSIDLGALASRHPNHFCNDLALSADGHLFITDSFAPVIYRVNIKERKAEIFLESDLFKGEGFNLNGIVVHPRDYLLVSKYNDGTLYRISLSKPSDIKKVVIKTTFPGADGLVLIDDSFLALFRNVGKNQMALLKSYDDFTSAAVVKTSDTQDVFPTTGVRIDKSLFVLNGALSELFAAPEKAKRSKFRIQHFRL